MDRATSISINIRPRGKTYPACPADRIPHSHIMLHLCMCLHAMLTKTMWASMLHACPTAIYTWYNTICIQHIYIYTQYIYIFICLYIYIYTLYTIYDIIYIYIHTTYTWNEDGKPAKQQSSTCKTSVKSAGGCGTGAAGASTKSHLMRSQWKHMIDVVKGNLEVKLPTYGQMYQQWWEESEARKNEKRKSQRTEWVERRSKRAKR